MWITITSFTFQLTSDNNNFGAQNKLQMSRCHKNQIGHVEKSTKHTKKLQTYRNEISEPRQTKETQQKL